MSVKGLHIQRRHNKKFVLHMNALERQHLTTHFPAVMGDRKAFFSVKFLNSGPTIYRSFIVYMTCHLLRTTLHFIGLPHADFWLVLSLFPEEAGGVQGCSWDLSGLVDRESTWSAAPKCSLYTWNVNVCLLTSKNEPFYLGRIIQKLQGNNDILEIGIVE